MPCDAHYAKKLCRQYVCSQHFSESDFTVADETRLDRLAVPYHCTAFSHPHSAQHCEESPLTSSPCEEDFHVLVPTKTYSMKSITSLTKDYIPIHTDTSLPSVVSLDKLLQAEFNTFSEEDTSYPHSAKHGIL
jgi:hypothetical protein